LSHVVIAGHSGGGQVVQRYAVLTRGEALVASLGIAVRYVIANPSSYVYFDALRPDAAGDFVPFDGAACADFNRWKYGLLDSPDYARPAARAGMTERREPDAAALEAAYARRDVLTLLGSEDCDPLHPALDISCAACAQGAHRLARGRAYARYMRMRHPQSLRHRVWEIAGVGHDGAGIFTSREGLAALFDTAGPPG
jgi:pimeloyl-ACP methyl ester carboxylesterase